VSRSPARIEDLVKGRSGLSGHVLEQGDVDRFVSTIRRLPEPPASVLDVGCGTGVLVDAIGDLGYESVGMDSDEGVMAAMTRPHIVADIAKIPAPDRSYDVVILNEILEHLPVGVYDRALAEAGRVARHRIVVTVPNGESLESATTRCPQCQCTYSVHGHVRRFERGELAALFPGFEVASIETVGPYKMRHRSVEWHLRRRILGSWPAQPGATCPQCDYRQEGSRAARASGSNPLVRLAKLAYAFPWQRWWLVASHDRTDHER
jgi:SAM-dependent methyltransferase